MAGEHNAYTPCRWSCRWSCRVIGRVVAYHAQLEGEHAHHHHQFLGLSAALDLLDGHDLGLALHVLHALEVALGQGAHELEQEGLLPEVDLHLDAARPDPHHRVEPTTARTHAHAHTDTHTHTHTEREREKATQSGE